LRYFPSGRGVNFPELALTEAENLSLVERAKKLCHNASSPRLDVHYLMPGTDKDILCRCVRKSIGILPDGNVTSCFWGIDGNGDISDNRFFLGNVANESLVNILRGDNACYWSGYNGSCPLDDNGGVNDVLSA
jgi:MoaA/NifB/PqqE/SkfB family radical SAM enzyme